MTTSHLVLFQVKKRVGDVSRSPPSFKLRHTTLVYHKLMANSSCNQFFKPFNQATNKTIYKICGKEIQRLLHLAQLTIASDQNA